MALGNACTRRPGYPWRSRSLSLRLARKAELNGARKKGGNEMKNGSLEFLIKRLIKRANDANNWVHTVNWLDCCCCCRLKTRVQIEGQSGLAWQEIQSSVQLGVFNSVRTAYCTSWQFWIGLWEKRFVKWLVPSYEMSLRFRKLIFHCNFRNHLFL